MTTAINESELISRAVAAVKRYRDHPEWWDIRQEAVLGALQSVERAQRLGTTHWQVACTLGARNAVTDYLYPRKYRGKETPEMLPLEDLQKGWEPTVPDPAPAIIGRVALWQTVENLATEQELEYARRVWLNGEVADAVAQEVGVSKSLVSLRLNNLRKRLQGAMAS